MASKTEPETGTTTFSYNADATLNYKIDAKGQKVAMVYDANKRVTQIQKFPDGVNEDQCQRVDLFYDGTYPAEGDAGVTAYANGRLSAVLYRGSGCGQKWVEQYSYTQYGAMAKKRLKMIRGAASGVLESVAEYDGEGRLLAVNYPITGKRYAYGFDSRGLPSTLTNTTDTVTLVSSVTYGVAGEMTAFATGGGTETRGYNVNGQMTTLNLPGRSITYNFPAAGANNGKVASIVDSGAYSCGIRSRFLRGNRSVIGKRRNGDRNTGITVRCHRRWTPKRQVPDDPWNVPSRRVVHEEDPRLVPPASAAAASSLLLATDRGVWAPESHLEK